MDGLRLVLLAVGVIIIIINFFINSGTLVKIISYCYQTNTLNQYWTLFFKNSMSGRAIISSLIGLVVAIIAFVIITPIILIRKSVFGKKEAALTEEGLLFQYPDLNLEKENLKFNSNIQQITGLQLADIEATGKLRIDAIMFLSEFAASCKAIDKDYSHEVMKTITLEDKKEAVVPVLLNLEKKQIPVYFIYNESHRTQYNTIKSQLISNGFKDCGYVSVIRM